jgi:hypothetical protein
MNAYIVAPEGRPLAAALLSVERLEAALSFWRDCVGFAPVGEPRALDARWNALWGMPPHAAGRMALLQACDLPVGRLLLVEWDVHGRQRIRATEDTLAFGLQNVNCYVPDAAAAVAVLVAAGGRPWTAPTSHAFGAAVGVPIEVVLEVRDGVALNLVELTSRDPQTRIGQMRAYVERIGHTRTGFSPIVTTSHVVRSIDAAIAFHRDVLRMEVLFDDCLSSDAANAFLRLPPGSRTRVTFLQGAHMYGKIALSEPLNYACAELAPRAHAPNLGYLAQVYEVEDLAAARAACAKHGVAEERVAAAVDLAGFGERAAAVVCTPFSGAPMLLLAPGQRDQASRSGSR